MYEELKPPFLLSPDQAEEVLDEYSQADTEEERGIDEVSAGKIVDAFIEGTRADHQATYDEWQRVTDAQAAILNNPAPKLGGLREETVGKGPYRRLRRLLKDDRTEVLSGTHHENLEKYQDDIIRELQAPSIHDEVTRSARLEELIQTHPAVHIPAEADDKQRAYLKHFNDARATTWRACFLEENGQQHIDAFLEDQDPALQTAFAVRVEDMIRNPGQDTQPLLEALVIYLKRESHMNEFIDGLDALYEDPEQNKHDFIRNLVDPSGDTPLQKRFQTAAQINGLLVTAEKGTEEWLTDVATQLASMPERMPSWFTTACDWHTTTTWDKRKKKLAKDLSAVHDDNRASSMRLTPAYLRKLKSNTK
jgi:hypothetical protein